MAGSSDAALQMADFSIQSDSVDVEQIMERIRARIREKRGVDYTEQEVQDLARVKLETFLDPRVVRSDLLEHYRRGQPSTPLPDLPLPPPPPDNYGFEADTIYASSRSLAGRIIALARKVLNPVLKLFFNPNPIIQVLHMQSAINAYYAQHIGRPFEQLDRMRQRFATRDDLDALNYEVLNNLVVEMTRLSIEVKNLKMRVESLSGRLDFDERRARALESAVQYRAPAAGGAPGPAPAQPDQERAPAATETAGQRARRRRRRRRRGGTSGEGAPQAGQDVFQGGAADTAGEDAADASAHDEADEPEDDTVQ
jgi:hypothetical protein